MSKKVTVFVFLLVAVAATPLFAQFRGTRLGLAAGTPNGVLVYRPSPMDVRLGYDFTEGNEYIFLSGDLRLVDNRRIVGVLHGSFGIGLYGKLYPEGRDDDGNADFDGGTRIPIGLSVLLLDNFLEFFVELAPGIDLYPKAQFSDDPIQLFAGFTIEVL